MQFYAGIGKIYILSSQSAYQSNLSIRKSLQNDLWRDWRVLIGFLFGSAITITVICALRSGEVAGKMLLCDRHASRKPIPLSIFAANHIYIKCILMYEHNMLYMCSTCAPPLLDGTIAVGAFWPASNTHKHIHTSNTSNLSAYLYYNIWICIVFIELDMHAVCNILHYIVYV